MEGNTPTTAPSWRPFSKKFWLTTRTMPPVQHSLDNTKRHTLTSPTITTQPISCMGGANPPPQHFTHWQPLLQPDCAHHSTWVLHLINWLNWPLTGQWGGVVKVKGHTEWGTPTPTHTGPSSNTQFRPNLRHQNQHQLTHTCTAHGWLGIATHPAGY